jgi:hypothetical protein
MCNHVLCEVFHDFKIGVDEFIVEFDLIFCEFVVVSVNFVDELPIEF